jgi:hypothetical protein
MYALRRLIFLIALLISFGCEPQMVDASIPPATFQDLVINLNLPDYLSIRVDGGFKLLNDIGVRGVILYRVDSKTYHAYERNCSYHPNEAGSTVDVHSSSLFMQDPSCGSTFSFEQGQPTGGPAWRPLRQYHTDVIGSTLTITSDIIN